MFEQYRKLADVVDQELAREVAKLSDTGLLHDMIDHSLLAPAKRLRAVLLMMTLEAYGYFWHRGLYPALSLEYIHCYSLIHDDLPCMDDDYLRRGRPTSHLRFGDAMALLAGDALLTESFGLLCRGAQLGAYSHRALADMVDVLTRAAGVRGMVAGQVGDLQLEGRDRGEADEPQLLERLRQVHLRKTGALLTAPFKLAAVIADLEESERLKLERFGAQFGLVFQIQDDLLDYTGDPQLMGKAVGRDLRQQKLTYPGLLGIERTQEILERETELLQELLSELDCARDSYLKLIAALNGRSS